MLTNIFSYKPALYSICKDLNNADRSRFFRTCKSLERWRSEPIYQKLFCNELGVDTPLVANDWPSTYLKIRDFFSSSQIFIKPIDSQEKMSEIEKMRFCDLKKVGPLMKKPTYLYLSEDDVVTHYKVGEDSELGYYTTCKTLVFTSLQKDSGTLDNPNKVDFFHKIEGFKSLCKGVAVLGKRAFAIAFHAPLKDVTFSIINMSNFKCINSMSVTVEKIDSFCVDGLQLFFLCGTNYYEVEFKY